MKLFARLRRDRISPVLEDRLRTRLCAEAERLFPGTDDDHMDPVRCGRLRCRETWPLCGHTYLAPAMRWREPTERLVRSYCRPIPCDIEDNYVCAAHRLARHG